jgi:hypothetical protein
MFPNVRLMIAATIASVVALICGSGMFAAFQVSHEPLVRLPSASAPLQRSTDNIATPMAYAAPEPFDRRFQISESGNAAEAVEALARKIDHRESFQSTPPAPEQGAAEFKATAAGEAPSDIDPSAPSPVAQPVETQNEKTAAPAADDRRPAISAQGDATPEPAASAATPAPNVAAIEPPAEPSLPQVQPIPGNEAAPASVTKPVDAAAAKETRPGHAAARPHRRHKASNTVAAQSTTYRDSPAQQADTQSRPARVHHAKIGTRETMEPGAATGGPLVSAPSR